MRVLCGHPMYGCSTLDGVVLNAKALFLVRLKEHLNSGTSEDQNHDDTKRFSMVDNGSKLLKIFILPLQHITSCSRS